MFQLVIKSISRKTPSSTLIPFFLARFQYFFSFTAIACALLEDNWFFTSLEILRFSLFRSKNIFFLSWLHWCLFTNKLFIKALSIRIFDIENVFGNFNKMPHKIFIKHKAPHKKVKTFCEKHNDFGNLHHKILLSVKLTSYQLSKLVMVTLKAQKAIKIFMNHLEVNWRLKFIESFYAFN